MPAYSLFAPCQVVFESRYQASRDIIKKMLTGVRVHTWINITCLQQSCDNGNPSWFGNWIVTVT